MLKMNSFNRTVLVLGLLLPMAFALAPSQIRLDPDGGYTGIVIKIDKEVPEEMCTQILSNLQVRTHQFICREEKYNTSCTKAGVINVNGFFVITITPLYNGHII